VGSPHYSESELYGGAMTVSFSKYFPWQEVNFLQRSTHFLVLQIVCRKLQEDNGTVTYLLTTFIFHVHFSVSKALPPPENRSFSHCIASIGFMDEL
jgi:hypothetical protein